MKITKIQNDGITYYKFSDTENLKNLSKLLYETFSETVEKIVSHKSGIYYNIIPIFDFDDLKQDIRVIALQALQKFDISKINNQTNTIEEKSICAMIYMFLSITISRRILNLKRDKFVSFKLPCTRSCRHYSGNPDRPCEKYCKDYIKYKKNTSSKTRVIMPAVNYGEIEYLAAGGWENSNSNVSSEDNQILKLMMSEAVDNDIDSLTNFLYKGKLSYRERAKIKKLLINYFEEEDERD